MKNKLYKFFWVLHSSSFGCSGFVSLPLHEQTKLHPCAHFCCLLKEFSLLCSHDLPPLCLLQYCSINTDLLWVLSKFLHPFPHCLRFSMILPSPLPPFPEPPISPNICRSTWVSAPPYLTDFHCCFAFTTLYEPQAYLQAHIDPLW